MSEAPQVKTIDENRRHVVFADGVTIYFDRKPGGIWSLAGACVMVDHLDEISWEAHRRAAETILLEHEARTAATSSTAAA